MAQLWTLVTILLKDKATHLTQWLLPQMADGCACSLMVKKRLIKRGFIKSVREVTDVVLRLIHEELLRARPLYLSPWQPTCCLDTTRCYLFLLDQTEPGSNNLCLLGKVVVMVVVVGCSCDAWCQHTARSSLFVQVCDRLCFRAFCFFCFPKRCIVT